MPTYHAECNRHGDLLVSFRFFHERQDATGADCPKCGRRLPVRVIKERGN